MYFIATGSAYVKRRNRLGIESFLGRLDEGSHFGDISMFYKTKRTATVVAGDFSILAKLTQNKYQLLL
jgi:CRP-like cAMP-binding protein